MCAIKGSGKKHLGESHTSPCVNSVCEARWVTETQKIDFVILDYSTSIFFDCGQYIKVL